MKKITLATAAAALAVAIPAQAAKPADPGAQGRAHRDAPHGKSEQHRSSHANSNSHRCMPRSVGYVAHGTFVDGALTQTAGMDTAEDRSDDRYSGTVTVAVTRTNKHARADKGTTKEYTLTDARVGLADRDGNGTMDLPMAGDRTTVKGQITRLNRHCDSTGFEAKLTVKRVKFHAPKVAAPSTDDSPASS